MKLAFLFPGQGSQAIGMGKDFYNNYSFAREMFAEASDVLKIDMCSLIFEFNDNINQTKYTQPAILLTSYIAYKIFSINNSISPVFTLGHSLGEITANLVSQSMSFSDALHLSYIRGELMQNAFNNVDSGMAVVVGLDDKVVEDFCKDKDGVWVANYNSDGQIVLAGLRQNLLNLQLDIKALGAKRFLMLPISIASHCVLLDEIKDHFMKILDGVLIDNFKYSVISNVTTKPYNTKDEALNLLTLQLTNPVFYKQSILNNQDSLDCFIEFGHGGVLKGLNKRITSKPTYNIFDIASLEQVEKQISDVL